MSNCDCLYVRNDLTRGDLFIVRDLSQAINLPLMTLLRLQDDVYFPRLALFADRSSTRRWFISCSSPGVLTLPYGITVATAFILWFYDWPIGQATKAFHVSD